MRLFNKHIGSDSRQKGFTLVELLVVIGIIAVLVGILLPALNKARRAAYTLQCSSNMRQVATAMLLYVQNNKNRLPPCQIRDDATGYPGGWWWPTELVRGKYILTPSIYDKPGGAKKFNRNNIFRCPEGIDEDAFKGGAGAYPTDGKNNGFQIVNDASAQAAGFGIASWYMLTSRVTTASNGVPGGNKVTPFLYFNGTAGQIPIDLKDPQYQRNLSMIKRAAEVVMIVEAADTNWMDQAQNTTPGYTDIYLQRLGARHGKKTANGQNAWTNFAFFDGHVGLYPTEPYTKVAPSWAGGSNPDNSLVAYFQDTIFYLNKQRGKK